MLGARRALIVHGSRNGSLPVRATVILMFAGAATARAQTGAIDGVVFDSLRMRPLAGALVAAAGAPAAVRTDADGRFALDSLAGGAYTLVVESGWLDSLGVAVPLTRVELAPGERRAMVLAVPSRATLLGIACRGSPMDADAGVLLGVVRDAADGAPVAGARVSVGWSVWTLAGARMVSQPVTIAVSSGAGGVFRVCGVPAGGQVRVSAGAGARSTAQVAARVPDFGIARHDLMVGAAGEGALRGTVTDPAGAPLAGARVQLSDDSAFAASDEHGAFQLAGGSSGTRVLEVRRVGSAPASVELELRGGSVTRVTVVLEPATQRLGAVTVHGSGAPATADAGGYGARKRTGIGRFVDREQIAARGDVEAPELLRGVQGMQVRFTTTGTAASWIRSGMGCTPNYYVDGTATDVRGLPRSNDIENLEVYAPGEAPPRYAGARASCAVVLIWTRRAGGAPAKPAPAPDSGASRHHRGRRGH